MIFPPHFPAPRRHATALPDLRPWLLAALFLAPFLMLAGCASTTPPAESPLVRLSPADYPDFSDDLDLASLGESLSRSLDYLARVPADRTFAFGPDTYTAAQLARTFRRFATFLAGRPSPAEMNAFLRQHGRVYRSAGEPKTGKVLFTGYFEPLLAGDRDPSPAYPYPVYGVPEDLAVVDLGDFIPELKGRRITGRVQGKTFVPYPERGEIEAGAIEGKAPVLAWVADRVGLFFLHVQGSGQIALPDGQRLHVHFAGQNGRSYRSVGQLLIQEGKVPVEQMSMQAIQKYLAEHPAETDRVLRYNASYIFFTTETDGPLGALNVKLTPGRSLAVDKSVLPLPALAFIRAQKPRNPSDTDGANWTPFSRFVLTQDTGGAIKGTGRADLFWGGGPAAEVGAGHMKHRGDLYVIVLEDDAPEKK